MQLIAAQIIDRKQSAVGLHIGVDLLRNLAVIEDIHTVLRDALQRRCEIRVINMIANALQTAVVSKVDTTTGARES